MRVLFLCLILSIATLGRAQLEEAFMKAELEAHYHKSQMRFKRGGQVYDLIYHHLKMNIDPAVRYVTGSVVSKLIAEEDNFTLFTMDLHSSMRVDSITSPDESIEYVHRGDEIQITIPPKRLGEEIEIEIYYQGDPTQHPGRGFSYWAHRDGPVAWSLSQPYAAIGWWPCKQQLQDKIDSIDISLTVPMNNIGASLGLLERIDTISDTTQTYHWKHRYPVATYLVAVTVSNFYEESHYIHLHDGDSVYHVDYLYPAYKPAADTLRWNIDRMMVAFDSLFGRYPFIKEKYGHVQISRSGGMEHQTLSSMGNLEYNLMAHELGHMWFGDKVTCATWGDLWLNEGWATYTNALAYEFGRPDQAFLDFLSGTKANSLEPESGAVYAYDTTIRAELFDGSIRYARGAMVLHQLRWEVGDEAFFEGTRNYLADAELCYGFAHTIDFQEAIEATSGQDLDGFFDRYIYKEGYPVLTITWNRKTNDVIELEVLQETTHPSVEFFPLKIPFRATGENGRDTLFHIYHTLKNEKLEVDLGFKVENVVYDPRHWLVARALVVEGSHADLGRFTLFPNPVGGELSVYLEDKKLDRLEVIDLQGRVLLDQKSLELKSGISSVNVSTLLDGIYFVKVYSGGESAVKRFIKK